MSQELSIFESIKKSFDKFAAYVINSRLIRLYGLTGLEKILLNIWVVKVKLLVCLGTFFFHWRLDRKELRSLTLFFGRGFVLPPFFTYRAILLTPRRWLGSSTLLNQKFKGMYVYKRAWNNEKWHLFEMFRTRHEAKVINLVQKINKIGVSGEK